MICRKQTSIINQRFTCKYKSNESNAEASTHYWIVWLSSKYVCFYAFMSNKSFSFFRSMFRSKTFKLNNFNISTNKAIKCLATSLWSSRFIIYASSSVVLGKLSLEKTPLNLGSFSWYFWISKFVKRWCGIRNFFWSITSS